jgi:hypothetical protein
VGIPHPQLRAHGDERLVTIDNRIRAVTFINKLETRLDERNAEDRHSCGRRRADPG